VPEGLGYPELLLSEAAMDIDLSGYSIARYSNDQLDYKYGDFPYYTNFSYMESYPLMDLFNLNGFWHIKQKLADNTYLVISRPNEKIAVQLVSFSVLFIILIILIFIISLVLFSKEAIRLLQMSFQNRLQIIFTSAISIIIILLASITLFYINIDNQNRMTKQLTEKTNSVIIELQHKLGVVSDLYSIDPIELEMLLKKFSLVFFSDINLYSPSGELISSSRPEIFKRGLLSENINPESYNALFKKNKLFFITQEDLGSITYYSSYAPLMLSSNQPAGIINLPYFAKQSEVTKSYYQMIFTFINLFVFLGIIGTLLVLVLSRIITKPLVVLQKNLAEIQIDKQNEIIEWKGNDEIGQLISAYNQMIIKLEQSTELLKQSERESAWREVAQQIAHEIKNPLTPMKLNVQHLERAFRENDPGLNEKVKNISEMLIAQIETLNKVAEMFSDFTKTKSLKFEKVDLANVIKKAIQLFKNHSDTSFTLNVAPGTLYYTKAFEKDLLRVFNNLIKNSLQSMDKSTGREIEIKLSKSENMLVVEFTDNGKGISEEIKANIFKPYFTTKSTGTGLGLAIIKNIMNEIGGEISLESTTTEGTRFVLKFQAI
jgi:signal transduction histidine kinase